MNEDTAKVLVKEKLADSGVNLLRERFDVDLGVDWSDEELAGFSAQLAAYNRALSDD